MTAAGSGITGESASSDRMLLRRGGRRRLDGQTGGVIKAMVEGMKRPFSVPRGAVTDPPIDVRDFRVFGPLGRYIEHRRSQVEEIDGLRQVDAGGLNRRLAGSSAEDTE